MEKSILALLKKLVAFKSVSAKKEEAVRIINFVQQYMGNNVVTKRIVSNGYANLLAYSKKHDVKKPFRILLNAHLDVVPAPSEMFTMTISDNKAMGRGVYDMKAAGAVMIELFARLSREGKLPDDAGLMLVTDEEIGGFNGTKAVKDSGMAETAFFFGGEPTDFRILYAHKGALRITVTYTGKSAHGSRPWEGNNANVKLAENIARFYHNNPLQKKEVWETTYSLNLLSGGTAFNIVPERAEAIFDIRRIGGESAAAVIAKVKRYFPGAKIAITMNEPGLATDLSLPEIKRLANIVKKRTGKKAVFIREHFATDARFYSAKGVPAIHLGLIGGGLHQTNEWVDIKSLEVYYYILKDFLFQKRI